MDQCRSDYNPLTEIDMSLKFTGPGFVLERYFVSLGFKEMTWFLKADLEDTPEEEELEGMEDEKLKRRKEEETHALVLAMKREWDVWLAEKEKRADTADIYVLFFIIGCANFLALYEQNS